jgi:hypothetical protein
VITNAKFATFHSNSIKTNYPRQVIATVATAMYVINVLQRRKINVIYAHIFLSQCVTLITIVDANYAGIMTAMAFA